MPLQSLFLLLFFSNNVATRDPWRTYMSCGHASAQKVRKGINYGRKKTFYLFFFETFFLQVKEKKMDYFPRSIYLLPGLLSSQNWPMYENFVTQFVGGRMAQNQFNANIPKLFFDPLKVSRIGLKKCTGFRVWATYFSALSPARFPVAFSQFRNVHFRCFLQFIAPPSAHARVQI